jgi:hypothetical protein
MFVDECSLAQVKNEVYQWIRPEQIKIEVERDDFIRGKKKALTVN